MGSMPVSYAFCVCAPCFLVCARLTTCVRAHTHILDLEGTTVMRNPHLLFSCSIHSRPKTKPFQPSYPCATPVPFYDHITMITANTALSPGLDHRDPDLALRPSKQPGSC